MTACTTCSCLTPLYMHIQVKRNIVPTFMFILKESEWREMCSLFSQHTMVKRGHLDITSSSRHLNQCGRLPGHAKCTGNDNFHPSSCLPQSVNSCVNVTSIVAVIFLSTSAKGTFRLIVLVAVNNKEHGLIHCLCLSPPLCLSLTLSLSSHTHVTKNCLHRFVSWIWILNFSQTYMQVWANVHCHVYTVPVWIYDTHGLHLHYHGALQN